jgi:hypothetical protein
MYFLEKTVKFDLIAGIFPNRNPTGNQINHGSNDKFCSENPPKISMKI